jgi:DNA-binding beta-propeller fold protein YncE
LTIVMENNMRTALRLGHIAWAVGLSLSAFGVHAQSVPLLQQGFGSGLGSFASVGTVTTSATGAVMVGSTFGADGAITSKAISTQGYKGITVEFDRSTKGMSLTDGGVIEYAVNGGAFTKLESTQATTLTHAKFTLPATAENASVTVRFRAVALLSSETYTVNNVLVSATPAGTSTGSGSAPAIGEFTTFETGHVRPMALSADGSKLYVVNTPDARVEVFDVTGATPVLKESISVGLEPVALAFAPNGQLWVVNHLSDSVSILDVSSAPARLVNTLWTGDEPSDIVFAGPSNRWAFITAAHRGQNVKFDPQLSKPNTGRADVWVFDANSPGAAAGGTPATVLNMFGDTLRGLARNADGSRVYTAVLHSGNRTTVLMGGPQSALDKPGPTATVGGVKAPATGLIVQKNANGDWVDGGDPRNGIAPKTWNDNVKLNLPDNDVFTIDTTTSVPVVINKTTGVGTTLYNLAVNPVSGKVYVSNLEARNVNRFEGPGTISNSVNGHFVESRITVIDGSSVLPRHLNKHITSYGAGLGTAAEKAAAVATPLEMAVSPDGGTLYLAAMGANKLARYSTAALENDSFTPSASQQLVLSGGLPTGVLLDAPRGRAYVTTRQDNGVSVVNTGSFTEAAHVKMYNPEPADVVNGRKFLYDATYTSSRGDSSCAGCHTFGDMDHLAWDLGNPDGTPAKNNNPYNRFVPAFLRTTTSFHPMKGPMTTQTFRGMAGNGPMHWRGDRQGVSAGATLEERAFKDFRVAFPGLLGRDGELPEEDLTAFARFALKIMMPPNPVKALDNSYTAVQQAGFDFYMKSNADNIATCNGCHVNDATKGQYGTDGTMAFEGQTISENFKIPQLRNMYQKVGFFSRNLPKFSFTGDQIRGNGYSLDGVQGSVNSFLDALVFITVSATNRQNLEEFVMVFPSNFDPVVGQQLTVTPANASQADVSARLNLLVQRASITSPRPECELLAKGVIGGAARGWVYSRGASTFVSDRRSDAAVSLSSLLSLAKTNATPLTFTCAPPGNGTRLGIDRNADGTPDGG